MTPSMEFDRKKLEEFLRIARAEDLEPHGDLTSRLLWAGRGLTRWTFSQASPMR